MKVIRNITGFRANILHLTSSASFHVDGNKQNCELQFPKSEKRKSKDNSSLSLNCSLS